MNAFKLGDRVVKNSDGWIPSDFDAWGAGEGVGVIVEPPWEHEDGICQEGDGRTYVDVRWSNGRCFKFTTELLPAPETMMKPGRMLIVARCAMLAVEERVRNPSGTETLERLTTIYGRNFHVTGAVTEQEADVVLGMTIRSIAKGLPPIS